MTEHRRRSLPSPHLYAIWFDLLWVELAEHDQHSWLTKHSLARNGEERRVAKAIVEFADVTKCLPLGPFKAKQLAISFTADNLDSVLRKE